MVDPEMLIAIHDHKCWAPQQPDEKNVNSTAKKEEDWEPNMFFN
jgi:hypothetical protein